jgi:beta-lactam-binding protein with PASTA domain
VPTGRVIVAGVVGLSRADATRTIVNEGLTPAVFEVPSSEPAGTVVAQAPAGGTRIEAGSPVRVNVSAGP